MLEASLSCQSMHSLPRKKRLLGIQDQELSQKLQLESDLTLDKAVTIADWKRPHSWQSSDNCSLKATSVLTKQWQLQDNMNLLRLRLRSRDMLLLLLLQLTPFLMDSTDSHMVVGLVVGLNPSTQAHVAHSRVQGVAQSTIGETVQWRDKNVTNVRNSCILHVVVKQRLLVKLKLILNHRCREPTLLTP